MCAALTTHPRVINIALALCAVRFPAFSKQKIDSDVRVLHNTALSEFFLFGARNVGALESSLRHVLDELRPTAYFDESDGIHLDVDSAYARYNLSVLSFQLHHYDRARQHAEELWTIVDALDDILAVRLALLLLELCMLTSKHSHGQAESIIAYIHAARPASALPPDLDSSSVSQAALTALTSLAQRVEAMPATFGFARGEFALIMSSYQTRLHVSTSSRSAAKKELKTGMQVSWPCDPSLCFRV